LLTDEDERLAQRGLLLLEVALPTRRSLRPRGRRDPSAAASRIPSRARALQPLPSATASQAEELAREAAEMVQCGRWAAHKA
tara:strand:- start:2010 stop:2255 length:246 start_codon:yes stop_codon:yes gene_type:complete